LNPFNAKKYREIALVEAMSKLALRKVEEAFKLTPSRIPNLATDSIDIPQDHMH